MNLASVNLAPKPSSTKAIEADGSALPENSPTPDDFAAALKGQEELFHETKNKEAQPAPQQQGENQASPDDLKPNADDAHQDLVALLGQYLPPSTTEKTLATEESKVIPGLETFLLPLSDELADTTPSTPPADPAVAKDMGNVMASAGLAFVKPIPEDVKPNTDIEPIAPETSLQKQIITVKSSQVSQTVTSLLEEGTDTFKQSLTSLTAPENETPQVKGELLPIQKPIDIRAENLVIAKPITHPGWSKDLGEQIIWMNNKEISAAEIKLNPAHLGPISIRIDVGQDNQTSIQFTAQHTETKEALEASIPKLKEMLLGQQLNLVNVNISQNHQSNQGRTPQHPFYGSPGNHEPNLEAIPNALDISETDQIVSKGLLSLYA